MINLHAFMGMVLYLYFRTRFKIDWIHKFKYGVKDMYLQILSTEATFGLSVSCITAEQLSTA